MNGSIVPGLVMHARRAVVSKGGRGLARDSSSLDMMQVTRNLGFQGQQVPSLHRQYVDRLTRLAIVVPDEGCQARDVHKHTGFT